MQMTEFDTANVVTVPSWVVSHLGGLVMIKREFKDCLRTWRPRSVALLVSIQAGEMPGQPYATCIMLGDVTESEENFAFHDIEPIKH